MKKRILLFGLLISVFSLTVNGQTAQNQHVTPNDLVSIPAIHAKLIQLQQKEQQVQQARMSSRAIAQQVQAERKQLLLQYRNLLMQLLNDPTNQSHFVSLKNELLEVETQLTQSTY
jgi:hypothetical protein